MLLAFIAVTAVLGSSRLRGFISLALGLTIGLVGLDSVSGQARLTFGIPQLGDGIDIVVVAVGIFALGEALWVAAHLRRRAVEVIPVGRPWMGKSDLKRSWKPWLRGTAFGFPFGAIPPAEPKFRPSCPISPRSGSPSIRRSSARCHRGRRRSGGRQQRQRGRNHGSDAFAGSAHQRNGRGDAGRACLLRDQPGPLLLQREGDLVWGLIASLFIGNTLLLLLNLPLAPMWAKLLRIPRPYLYAGILFFASMGAYAVNGSSFDLFLLLVFGLIGFGMRRFGLPILPLIVAVILGPGSSCRAGVRFSCRRVT